MKAERHFMISQTRATVFFLGTVFALFLAGGMSSVQADQAHVNEMLKKAKYVGMDTCVMCHEKEGKEYKLSTHARIHIKDDTTGAQDCEICHGPGSIHADASGGTNNIINPKRDPEICFTCHTDKRMQFRLPYHHPVLEGKMSCTDCHDPHGIDVMPWTATSENGVNDTCLKCHTDKRGPYIWEHDAMKEGCTSCHQVHGSVNDKMLIARDLNLCLRCHSTATNPGFYSHATLGGRFGEATCWSAGCHQAIHGSNFSQHLRY
jgi:predicted CXXCH cytochrome family protein